MISGIINIGISTNMKDQLKQQVILTNKLLLILILVDLLLLFPIVFEDGWAIGSYLALGSLLVLIGLIMSNHFGYYTLSRIGTSLYPSFIVMVAAILIKQSSFENVRVFDFFDARILIAGFFILPFILFSIKEWKQLFSTITIIFFLVVAFDPIHDFFGVGYEYYFGTMAKAYIVSGIYIDIVLLFVAGSLFYFKADVEKLLDRNLGLAKDLGEKNIELSALFDEQESSNAKLTDLVEAKTSELRESNEELVRHNNELQQFSNTLSHNLRGPVASLLGLSKLFKMDNSEENRVNVADHIFKSATTLDDVIKDLNKVVDLKNNLHQIKEKIDIRKEIEDIWFLLDENVKQCNGKLILDIKMSVLYGIRSYVNSVLYNLISNAIKYHHPNRDCIIRISVNSINNKCKIKVQDNGVGIDLIKYGDKMFGMYQRFHHHLDGKGLGLFLTKQQVETMNGKISVESKLNTGTQFSIELPSFPLSQIESQLFYNSDLADIYLDVINNITTLVWKKMPDPIGFRDVFKNNIEIFKTYNTDLWVVDLSLMVNRKALEKQWILGEVIDQYFRLGIRKVAIIRIVHKADVSFWNELFEICKTKSINIVYTQNINEAKEKLLNL
ncbi:MAG: HAMP domain-containing histidine kinase [Cyclobacteriaceae bacterium]|nr:HAMP domain-containing histidine kinase [Cyclobacteriaceae bacterium]